jgi:hypothetical protein
VDDPKGRNPGWLSIMASISMRAIHPRIAPMETAQRLLFSILVYVVISSEATAQNKVSQALLGLSEGGRNEVFTDLLRDGNVRCDRVIRTLFNGATSELDVWEALCQDRNSYSLSIPPVPNADIELVSCHELLATSKMLLERAGSSKTKATGCRIKRAERLHPR